MIVCTSRRCAVENEVQRRKRRWSLSRAFILDAEVNAPRVEKQLDDFRFSGLYRQVDGPKTLEGGRERIKGKRDDEPQGTVGRIPPWRPFGGGWQVGEWCSGHVREWCFARVSEWCFAHVSESCSAEAARPSEAHRTERTE